MKIFFVNRFSPKENLGGSEIQCWLLAKYLSRRGHQTAYLALEGLTGEKQSDGEGFEVFFLSLKGESKFKALAEFYKILKKERPDICYIRIFTYLFFLNKMCRLLRIPVVFNTSHINDCKPVLEGISFSFNPFAVIKSFRLFFQRYLNFLTLKNVNVVSINKYQVELLEDRYEIRATPIYNSMEDNYLSYQISKQKQVVWVNNIKGRKRPEVFIELAEKLKETDYKFLMIGAMQDADYKNILEEAEKKNDNFKYLGCKTLEEVDKILAGSEIFVNTCREEGFGNNFIQAWFNKCPTITLDFDPDDIIETQKIGFKSGSLDQMVKDLKFLMANADWRVAMAKRARGYALANHSIESNIVKYEEFFKWILEK